MSQEVATEEIKVGEDDHFFLLAYVRYLLDVYRLWNYEN